LHRRQRRHIIRHIIPSPLEAVDWTLPIPIHYGPGRLGELGQICAQAGLRNPLMVTHRGSRSLPVPGLAEIEELLLEGIRHAR
jgi:hypothetical protein